MKTSLSQRVKSQCSHEHTCPNRFFLTEVDLPSATHVKHMPVYAPSRSFFREVGIIYKPDKSSLALIVFLQKTEPREIEAMLASLT